MILLLNGAFGIGKTTVARLLVERMPGSLLFDPELIGIPLQRAAHLAGRAVDDFQDLHAWRSLTIAGLRAVRLRSTSIVVPMAISNEAYLTELRDGIARFEPQLLHACLVAPVDVVHDRLRKRGAEPARDAWQFRRAAECCAAHGAPTFAIHVDASHDALRISRLGCSRHVWRGLVRMQADVLPSPPAIGCPLHECTHDVDI